MRIVTPFFLILVVFIFSPLTVPAEEASTTEQIPSFENNGKGKSSDGVSNQETVTAEPGEVPDEGEVLIPEEDAEEAVLQIADPLYPWNKAMYHVNDKFYFWFMKPLAQGYSTVVPEDMRLSVSNFFENITTPIRLVSSLLQLRIKDAGNELLRFVYNSTAGVCGLADAAKEDLGISRQDEDLGQALGRYGIGHGIYLVWPFLGPSSLRDTVGRVGDRFLDPVHYLNPTATSVGISVSERVNETSFRIGDYEDLKKSAIDPYISIRDAYLQYRKKKVED